MFIELIKAFVLIFFAEMGDKSQILAMTFATRYKVKNVIIGISLGIFLNHTLAVLIGVYIPDLFELFPLSFVAGLVFLLFGYLSLQVTEEVQDIKRSKYGTIFTISFAIFVGELGDKTQLSAILLASETNYPLLILFSTVSAMILTSMLGIYIGLKFGSKVPDFMLKIVSSLIFVVFGVLKIIENIPSSFDNSIMILVISIVLLLLYLIRIYHYRRQYTQAQSAYKRKAEELKNYFLYIKDKLEDICLGTKVCSTCEGNFCLLGYIKVVVQNTLQHKPVKVVDITKKTRKNFDKEKIKEALAITINVLKDDWNNVEYHNLHEIRMSLELLLYDQVIETNSYEEYQKKASNL